jgi:hypothetical protein
MVLEYHDTMVHVYHGTMGTYTSTNGTIWYVHVYKYTQI